MRGGRVTSEQIRRRWREGYLPAGLALLAFAVIVSGIADPGITWDEANFLPSMGSYARWYGELFDGIIHGSPGAALSRDLVTERWNPTHENPPLALIAATVTAVLFEGYLGLLTAARLGSAIAFGLLALVVYKLTARIAGWTAGTFAALSLIALPRLVGHARLAALDEMMALTWLLTIYAFLRGTDSRRWAMLTGVFFGLALATKLNAFFLPLPLLVWGYLFRKRHIGDNVMSMTFIGPAVWIFAWPWLWHDTGLRIIGYLASKLDRAPIPVHYLGVTYQAGEAPWHYAILMTAVTVPVVLLLLAAAGASRITGRGRVREGTALLLLGLAASLAPFFLPAARKYDGVRLFLPAFPVIACLAGCGLDRLTRAAGRAVMLILSRRRPGDWEHRHSKAVQLALSAGILVLAASAMVTFRMHPYQLSYYNSIVGGLRGAERLGLETTYWGDALTPVFLQQVAEAVPRDSSIAFYPCGSNARRLYEMTIRQRERGIRIVERDEGPDYLVLIRRQGYFDDKLRILLQGSRRVMDNSHRGTALVSVHELRRSVKTSSP